MRWHERGVEYEPTGKFNTPPAGDDDITSIAPTRSAAPPAPPPPRKAAAASSSVRMDTAAISDAPTSPANLKPSLKPAAAALAAPPKSKSLSGTSIAMLIGAALLAMAALAIVLLRSRL
jgi:hypothetical protein